MTGQRWYWHLMVVSFTGTSWFKWWSRTHTQVTRKEGERQEHWSRAYSLSWPPRLKHIFSLFATASGSSQFDCFTNHRQSLDPGTRTTKWSVKADHLIKCLVSFLLKMECLFATLLSLSLSISSIFLSLDPRYIQCPSGSISIWPHPSLASLIQVRYIKAKK